MSGEADRRERIKGAVEKFMASHEKKKKRGRARYGGKPFHLDERRREWAIVGPYDERKGEGG